VQAAVLYLVKLLFSVYICIAWTMSALRVPHWHCAANHLLPAAAAPACLPALCCQVWLMLSDGERKQLTKLKQDLQEVRAMTTDMYGLGQAVGGSLLQGERGSGWGCSAPHVPDLFARPTGLCSQLRQPSSLI
jgi:hypothetical protein